MYREPSINSSNDTMNSADTQNRAIPAPQGQDALSLFMKDLKITPSNFTIVMDNPRARSSPQNVVFKKSRSEGKGSSRWQATAEDSIMSGLKTMSSTSSSSSNANNKKTNPNGKKKLRRKLKKEFADEHSMEDSCSSRATPQRSSSFDAVSVRSRGRDQHQQYEDNEDVPRRQPPSRSQSDFLKPVYGQGHRNHNAPTVPRRRHSREVDKALVGDQAPRMAVRKQGTSYKVSTANAKMPIRSRRQASKSPTRTPSRSPSRSNYRVMVS